MNATDNSAGRIARLPDGQRVAIESREGDSAVCRRIGGPRQGSLAICRIANLRPLRPRKRSSVEQQEPVG
jgi:hypothetical protein